MPPSTSPVEIEAIEGGLASGEIATSLLDPLLEARLVVPHRHVGTLRRTRLLRQLRSARDRPVISMVAPPGYGKSSLLVQWATEGSAPVAWLTADDSDSDPVVFLTELAAAIDRRVPLGAELFSAIAADTVSHRTVVGRLLAVMSRPREPVRLAIDDAHRITSRACLDILAELVEHLPDGSQVAIAGRARMRLPFARWRAAGSLLEFGPTDLAMDKREAVGLGRELGLRLPADTATRLSRETEGWPALLALAMLGAGTSKTVPDRSDAGTDHFIDDYLRSEVLDRRATAEVTFLTRTSILDDLPAPLCDVVADRHGSTEILRQLSRSTLLIDEYGGSYRYHTLLRDFLQRELAIREPQMLATLHRRAAAWYQANDAIEHAVDHAFAAEDSDLVATLVGNGFGQLHWSGHRATIRAWARRLGPDVLEAHPWLAVLGAWEEIAAGDVAGTIRLADVAERGAFAGRPHDGTASFESGRAMLRAATVRRGADDALANATRAVELEGDHGSWRDFALWQLAFARLTFGDVVGADEALADAVVTARSSSHLARLYCVLGHRALVAAQQGAWDAAAAHIAESDTIDPVRQVDGYLSSVPSRVVRIKLMIHRGDIGGARRELARAAGLRPLLTAAAPAGAVQLLLAFARAHVAIDDQAGARALVAQANDVIRDRPDLGVLPAEVASLKVVQDARASVRGGGATSLTVAELRVLSFLPYYLSFKEIGQRLGVKETTIKSQSLAIYQKLGAATRSDAVDLAVDAGLLEHFGPVGASRPPTGSPARA
jgi:LuxR family maltose regulon positive regulatory protein